MILDTGWTETEAGIVADWHAGFTVPQIAARCGWGTPVIARTLRRHGVDPVSRQAARLVPRWTAEETASIAGASDGGDAWQRYCAVIPEDARRTRSAVGVKFREMRRRGGRKAPRAQEAPPAAVSSAFRRPPDVPGVPGVPSVEWVMEHDRCEWQGAKYDRQRVARFVLRHGVEAVLHGDIVDLEDLDHVGKEFCGRRGRARRAQKILQDFHGVPR